jgi:hypothetical protein
VHYRITTDSAKPEPVGSQDFGNYGLGWLRLETELLFPRASSKSDRSGRVYGFREVWQSNQKEAKARKRGEATKDPPKQKPWKISPKNEGNQRTYLRDRHHEVVKEKRKKMKKANRKSR